VKGRIFATCPSGITRRDMYCGMRNTVPMIHLVAPGSLPPESQLPAAVALHAPIQRRLWLTPD